MTGDERISAALGWGIVAGEVEKPKCSRGDGGAGDIVHFKAVTVAGDGAVVNDGLDPAGRSGDAAGGSGKEIVFHRRGGPCKPECSDVGRTGVVQRDIVRKGRAGLIGRNGCRCGKRTQRRRGCDSRQEHCQTHKRFCQAMDLKHVESSSNIQL